MLFYSEKITPRLEYITGILGNLIFGEPLQLTSDLFFFSDYTGPKINYTQNKISDKDFLIRHADLLFESSIREQTITCFEVIDDTNAKGSFKALFKTEGDYPFDIFAASFYLLSRYEEYLPHKKDMYGRYYHENSVAFREKFLQIPLINIWAEHFKKAVEKKFSKLNFKSSIFSFHPTYDIDEAFAYRHKRFIQTAGGILKSISRLQWSILNDRINTLRGNADDPFEAYQWMDSLHEKLNMNPVYFFLVAENRKAYDRNIPPSHPAMQKLIKETSAKYRVGIHPSWQSGDQGYLLRDEIKKLELISEKKIIASRQHYIRFTLPQTFRKLIAAGIREDYSIGYGSINGFRASAAFSFYWYDLEKEQQTELLLHPFCFMEANSYFEQNFLPQRAFEEMMYYYHIVKSVNGTLITIWHNNFLGNYPLFRGWKEVYEEFVKIVCRTK